MEGRIIRDTYLAGDFKYGEIVVFGKRFVFSSTAWCEKLNRIQPDRPVFLTPRFFLLPLSCTFGNNNNIITQIPEAVDLSDWRLNKREMIRIGYACINTQLPSASRTCRLKNATSDRILALSRQNLAALDRILQWNHVQGIRLFRISSETIPFASHKINRLHWWNLLEPEIRSVGRLIQACGIRVSMHPGQYTVLNSSRESVVGNSKAELAYHARLLGAMDLNGTHKIVLHIGGTYKDKRKSADRFISNFDSLPKAVRRRLVIENDEKNYTAEDVLGISKRLRIPMVFDVFHHVCNPSFDGMPLSGIIAKIADTWKKRDGTPKIHYSDQNPGKSAGAHSESVDIRKFRVFYDSIRDMNLDVMLEVKDKEQSVLKVYRAILSLPSTASGKGLEQRIGGSCFLR